MSDVQRVKLRAVLVCVAMLPISALLVWGTTDRPLGWGELALFTLLADFLLCVFLGTLCLVLGLVASLINSESVGAKGLMRFGAALALIFLTVARLWALCGAPEDRSET